MPRHRRRKYKFTHGKYDIVYRYTGLPSYRVLMTAYQLCCKGNSEPTELVVRFGSPWYNFLDSLLHVAPYMNGKKFMNAVIRVSYVVGNDVGLRGGAKSCLVTNAKTQT